MLISESLQKEISKRVEISPAESPEGIPTGRACNWTNVLGFLLSSDGLAIGKEKLKSYILDNRSTFWKLVLRQPPKGNILHLGTDDWGKTALDLRNSANKITYLDFDCNNWRMKAVQLRLKEAGINNAEFILWNKGKALPFIKDTFDLIVINGFLDDDNILPEKYSFIKRITGEIYPILKKDGELFMSTDNKWYQKGSYNSYKKLLLQSGFNNLRFWSAMPDYRNFNYIIPLDNYAVLRYWIRQIDSHTLRNKIRSIGLFLCLKVGIVKYVVPNFCITAYK